MLTRDSRSRDFPGLEGIAYLNTAAESIPPLCVNESVDPYLRDSHFAAVESCREVSARFLGLQPSEVSFCSCSSEAYNLLATALNLQPGDEVVVSDLDFPAGVTPWLAGNAGAAMKIWQSNSGELKV